MQELWSSASYEPSFLSLPFAFAPAAMLVVITYALVMRGEPQLRTWLLVHYLALMPYSLAIMLSPSVTSERAAESMFRIAAAFIPAAAAAGAGFQFRILGKQRQARWFVWFCVAVAALWVALGATNAAVTGVHYLPGGLWYPTASGTAWLALLSTVVIASPGFLALGLTAVRSRPSPLRRQLRLVLAANIITYSGLTDVALAYGVQWFPMGWLLSGVGSIVVARALVTEDLLRVRAVDTTAPQLVLHLAGAILLGWGTLNLAGRDAPWWLAAAAVATSFAAVRIALAVIALITRGARRSESTLDRLLAQIVSRARPLETGPAIAALTSDVVELGLGVRPDVLLAAAEDYGWTTQTGAKLGDEDAPDPLLGAWLVEHGRAVFADELDGVPEDLRAALAPLFERTRARTIVPVASSDELLALVLVPASARRLRGRELGFLIGAAERLGEAIVHARMRQQAAERAMIARQVELAATLQAQLLPGPGPHKHGDITLVGSWLPATRCAGDFWGVYPLGSDGKLLVAIGDVTGHGVASATVTAAATAAVEVAVRRGGAMLDLAELVTSVDAAVRRVGGGHLHMTLFAGVLDPQAREIRFVSCGHPTPYVCRARPEGPIDLMALVARGNPLGTNSPPPKVQHKSLEAGDLVVWYTDGVIEAQAPSGEPFGDRRLQRMLRKLEHGALTPGGLHGVIHASVAAHRAGTPRGDDETLVVAQWSPPRVEASS